MARLSSEKLKYRSQNAQNKRSSEISSHIFETYKNAVRPHGCHIYNTAADMAMEKCVVPINIMGSRTVNMCYVVVINA